MFKKDNSIAEEILKSSYEEHFKYAKDIALILPIDHPKRIKIQKELNIISDKIQNINKK